MASNVPEEPEDDFYVMEGKRYIISEAEVAFEAMLKALDEIKMEGTDDKTLMKRIIERVQVIMATHYGTITKDEKLKERAVQLRSTIRKRITESMKRILEIIEMDPTSKDAGNYAIRLNGETVELQRLNLDETALTLIIRKDMTDGEFKKDRELRKDRQERVNTALRKAAQWIEQIPPTEDGKALELSLLTSKEVPEIDEEYDMTIVQATIEQEEADTIARIQEEEVRIREVSPEPEKSPERQTSTPRQSAYVPPDKRRVTFDQTERLDTIGERYADRLSQTRRQEVRNGVYAHPGYNPRLGELEGARKVPHLKQHEDTYFRLQNYYQTEVPLFPGSLGTDQERTYRMIEDAIRQSIHRDSDTDFTRAIKNLSNNLAVQYSQPGVNEKVPKFDGDYTKWNAFWQAFTVLVDKNPKLPVVTKLNRLNAAVEGEAHKIISMFEFDEESYELAKMALIMEYGDPVLGANKMLKDLQNMDRVKPDNIDGLRNLHVRSKQLVLRLQRLYPSILEQPILISSIIENKMSPECLKKWEEENTHRRREKTLPAPNMYVAWTLNWLNDYIQTNKRSTIKMEIGNSSGDPDKSVKPEYKKPNGNPKNGKFNGGNRRTLNNFYTMADQKNQQTKEKGDICFLCEGKHHVFKCKMEGVSPKVARDRAMKAGACLNCLSTDHYMSKCKAGGCKVKGCGRRHNTRLHDPDLHNAEKKKKTTQ